MTTDGVRLWQNPGWGSAIVEAQLASYGMEYELVEAGDIWDNASARVALQEVNPTGQVPALMLPSGEVMTESAAITLLLAEMAGSDALVPAPGQAERPAFLRWLVFLVANIYPCFTFADKPERFVPAADGPAFRTRVDEHEKRLWRMVGAEAARRGGPWVLGERYTALDVYVGVMAHWRPGKHWFHSEESGLGAIAEAVAARKELRAVFARNFG